MSLYPVWLSYLIPELKIVNSYKKIVDNSYYLFCGRGMPSIYRHTLNSIKDINDFNEYDYLVVCLDGENLGIEKRREKLLAFLKDNSVELTGKCKLRIIVQNACVETWFLGNRKIVKVVPEGELLKSYKSHYDVREYDPELMPQIDSFKLRAHFHESYLREVFKEHSLSYSKSKPKEVLERSYLTELERRVKSDNELNSLGVFLDLVEELRKGLV